MFDLIIEIQMRGPNKINLKKTRFLHPRGLKTLLTDFHIRLLDEPIFFAISRSTNF